MNEDHYPNRLLFQLPFAMRVAIVNTYDREGGAARAAHRLHVALRRFGIESMMFVQHCSSAEEGISGKRGNWSRVVNRLHWQLDHLPAQVVGARRGEFSVNLLGSDLRARLLAFGPDIVHLHWINAAFVSVGEVAALPAPVYWTAHDMWPFTGGCHYDRGCGNFELQRCQPCPMQHQWPTAALAKSRLRSKAVAVERRGIGFICPSRWMADVARRSPVARQSHVSVIPNGIDLARFKAIDRQVARHLFDLPQDRVVLLFGGMLSDNDPRKGFRYLDEALALVARTPWASQVSLCVFGSAVRQDTQIHGIPVRFVGHLHDEESLIALYSACDLFIAPSLQDNLPNTVLEAAACSAPVIAFNIGGMSDLVKHGVSGWLARATDAAELYAGIVRGVGDPGWRHSAGQAARAHVEEGFGYATVAAAHADLYESSLRTVGSAVAVSVS